ncbi:hypothetical protein Hanom_Chr10g00944511 [Helianthus anomalus]
MLIMVAAMGLFYTQSNGPEIFEQCHGLCNRKEFFFQKVKVDDVMKRFKL